MMQRSGVTSSCVILAVIILARFNWPESCNNFKT